MKIIKIFALIMVLTAFMAMGCNNPPASENPDVGGNSSLDSTVVSVIEVSSSENQIQLKDTQVFNHDYKQYFTVTENGNTVVVKDSFLDLSNLSESAGEYLVTCTYGEQSAQLTVIVIQTVYEVTLLQDEIKVNKSLALSYDYLSLFSASVDGNSVAITADMVNSTVQSEVGEYTVTVTNGNASKTLKVIVTNEHETLVVITYPNFEISLDQVEVYDYTNLFALYVDGNYCAVTAEMLDTSAMQNAQVGGSYQITLNHIIDSSEISATATVKVIENQAIVINAKNVITYPNSQFIDVTTLFEIKKGNEIIPVTNDMISGSIDYSTVGINQITLNYQGQTAVATVEIKLGVIINYAKSDTVTVKLGTNKETYAFSNDFVVLINGIQFKGFESYIDTSNVDFSTAGSYVATLTIPYNDKKFGLSGVTFDNITKDITYVVVANNYSYNLIDSLVTLKKGTTSYNAYSNVKLTINGRNQSFTEVKEYVDVMTCYYEVINPIDFDNKGMQEITLALYVNGVNAEPIIVSYSLIIESDVVISATDSVVYSGATLFTTDLFTITEGGENVAITYDMISGKVDTLKPGMYLVTATYDGVSAQAKVVVLDNAIKGNYSTMLHTIAENSSDYDENYGDTTQPTRRLGDLIINEQGGIRVLGSDCTITSIIDESTLRIKVRSYDYTLYYFNGIIVLDPDNNIKLPYSADKRPLIYFHKDFWTLEERLIINQYSNYVLNATSVCYSIDAFKITNKETNNSLWYALKVNLVEKNNPDTVYTVEWGEITFNEDLAFEADAVNYYTFNGITERFVMADRTQGQVKSVTEEKTFANKVFNGNINGKTAQLFADSNEAFTLKIDNQVVFKASVYDIEQMTNGYIDHKNNEVFLYDVDDAIYSYKFAIDIKNESFTVIEKDEFYGLYEIEKMFIFLDGYGTGIVNFDTAHFYKYQFIYTATGNKIDLRFINTKPSFAHGSGATLFMDEFGNVLTANYFADENLIGKRFVNSGITDGIIVDIDSYQVGADSDSVAKNNLLNNIHIRTVNGLLTNSEKANYVQTNFVRFNTPGFYKFTITATVNGKTVEVPYTVQVLEAIYTDNPIVATYGEGVIFKTNSLMINKYGQAVVNVNGLAYSGSVKVFEDNSFVINASNGAKTIKVDGKLIENGLISVRCTGSETYSDYYTTGTQIIAGTSGCVLRIITLADKTVFIRSLAATAVGDIVTAEVVSGTLGSEDCILKITQDGTQTFAKIVKVGDASSGLQLADAYRGDFTASDSQKVLTFDGFGKVVSNGTVGSYKLLGNVATVYLGSDVIVYRLNSETGIALKEDIALNNTLVQGKSYSATYNFYADSGLYSATTTFVFGEKGVVTAISTSSEFTEDSFETYEPPFASNNGVSGSYYVKGDEVTVTINGYIFTFRINFLLRPDALTCTGTTLLSEAHGYFGEGTVFTI